ncbi:cell division protein ZapD [Corallincola luteus]|uniref:Cell division protein ZapD n=1 Tax=Corallincola luteus TaxID=1775177 RepID=A0ABY2AL22_9GAMM|nr:cell division protein ZapD [Corallincola luteus]TCI03599.1 cell division protein ZapD [Corallincola luteus]
MRCDALSLSHNPYLQDAALLFEYPLNEKIRSQLRVEYLVHQMRDAGAETSSACLGFFRAVFELLELLERGDLRQELIKDLEKQQIGLERWEGTPGVDQHALQQLKGELQQLITGLRAEPRLGQSLREDKFLAALRQRFAIPGGHCCFDLPQLHLWLHQPQGTRSQQMAEWLRQLSLLSRGIALNLQLIREKTNLAATIARSGFYQASAEDVQMVRIQLPQDLHCYPTVSGNRLRYTIRFHQLDDENQRALEQDVNFQVAAC